MAPKYNPDCPNKNCMGGVITFDGQTGRLCKKCNPSPKRTAAAFNADTYPSLYSYLIWCNHYENLWYAIPRSQVVQFFSGLGQPDGVLKAHNFSTLLSKIK